MIDDAADTQAAFREALDREAIALIPRTYVRGFDGRDWDLVRSCFTEDAQIEGALGHPPATESLRRSRELSDRCSRTVHLLGTQVIEMAGDRGFVETYVIGFNWMGSPPGAGHPENAIVGARYLDTVVRLDGRWRISFRRLARDWVVTDPDIVPEPGELLDRKTRL